MKKDPRQQAIAAFARDMAKRQGFGYQTKLAEALGMPRDSLSRVLRGGPGDLSEDARHKLAHHFNVEYEDAIAYGQALLRGETPPEPPARRLSSRDMEERGFIAVPFSSETRLSAGRGGFTVPGADSPSASPIVVHGPSLGLRSALGLHAFRVGGDSMEPVLAQNGIVLVDFRDTDIERLARPAIYMLAYDQDDPSNPDASVKWLSWTVRPYLAIESENRAVYPPVHRAFSQVQIVGRVIWSWRSHAK
jgi:transcriptional regulator with XRE-family HTH domain